MRVFGITHNTRVNGPGRRTTVHLAGCHIHCKGCFSQHTWDSDESHEMPLDTLLENIYRGAPDGVSLSGGEPLEQAEALRGLLLRLREGDRDGTHPLPRGVLVFTGKTLAQAYHVPEWSDIQALIDCAIIGPYMESRKLHPPQQLRSSSNQVAYSYSDKIRLADLDRLPVVEVHIAPGGNATLLGFPTQKQLNQLQKQPEVPCPPSSL